MTIAIPYCQILFIRAFPILIFSIGAQTRIYSLHFNMSLSQNGEAFLRSTSSNKTAITSTYRSTKNPLPRNWITHTPNGDSSWIQFNQFCKPDLNESTDIQGIKPEDLIIQEFQDLNEQREGFHPKLYYSRHVPYNLGFCDTGTSFIGQERLKISELMQANPERIRLILQTRMRSQDIYTNNVLKREAIKQQIIKDKYDKLNNAGPMMRKKSVNHKRRAKKRRCILNYEEQIDEQNEGSAENQVIEEEESQAENPKQSPIAQKNLSFSPQSKKSSLQAQKHQSGTTLMMNRRRHTTQDDEMSQLYRTQQYQVNKCVSPQSIKTQKIQEQLAIFKKTNALLLPQPDQATLRYFEGGGGSFHNPQGVSVKFQQSESFLSTQTPRIKTLSKIPTSSIAGRLTTAASSHRESKKQASENLERAYQYMHINRLHQRKQETSRSSGRDIQRLAYHSNLSPVRVGQLYTPRGDEVFDQFENMAIIERESQNIQISSFQALPSEQQQTFTTSKRSSITSAINQRRVKVAQNQESYQQY